MKDSRRSDVISVIAILLELRNTPDSFKAIPVLQVVLPEGMPPVCLLARITHITNWMSACGGVMPSTSDHASDDNEG